MVEGWRRADEHPERTDTFLTCRAQARTGTVSRKTWRRGDGDVDVRPPHELKMLDELRKVWGLKRNSALRRLIVEGYQREVATPK